MYVWSAHMYKYDALDLCCERKFKIFIISFETRKHVKHIIYKTLSKDYKSFSSFS